MTSNNVVTLHRQLSIQLVEASGFLAVRTPRSQKDPGPFGWDPKANTPENTAAVLHKVKSTDDNFGIHLHGNVVDVDVDTDDPNMVAALDYFLPPTPHVWGRESRRRTHRLYQLPPTDTTGYNPNNYPFLERLKKDKSLSVEVRGGRLESGQYSLLPGSVHPSGEAYEWDNIKAAKTTPVATEIHRIINAIRYACAAVVVSRHWTEGQRNDMCMAFSGFLHRASMHMQETGGEGGFTNGIRLDRQDCFRILECVMELADDDEADAYMRKKTFDKTWDKADSGTPVRGATHIEKLTGDTEIVGLLYTLLTDSPGLVELDEFMQRYALVMNTSNVVDLQRAGSKTSAWLMSLNDFHNSYQHKTFINAEGKEVPMTRVLSRSKRTIRVEGFCCRPDQEQLLDIVDGDHVERKANLWRGYHIPKHPEPVTEEEVEPFLRHIRLVLASGNPSYYHWILAWYADLFQNPGTKSGTAMVLVGKPGAGKSVVGDTMRHIIGQHHSMQTNDIAAITHNFNEDSAAMLFVQADEATNTRRKTDALRMKSLVTDFTQRIEPKGRSAFQVESIARYNLTSNEKHDAVAIVDGQDDRRYAVFEVSNVFAARQTSREGEEARKKHWADFYGFTGTADNPNRENLAKLHRFLSDYQYDREILRVPPDTEARRLMAQHSERGFDNWLMKLVGLEHPFETLRDQNQRPEESYIKDKDGKYQRCLDRWPEYVYYTRLVESYNENKKQIGGSGSTLPSYNEQQIKANFVERGLISDEKSARVRHQYERWVDGMPQSEVKNIRISRFPEKSKIQEYLKEKLGYDIEEEAEDVTTNTSKPEYGGDDNF